MKANNNIDVAMDVFSDMFLLFKYNITAIKQALHCRKRYFLLNNIICRIIIFFYNIKNKTDVGAEKSFSTVLSFFTRNHYNPQEFHYINIL